MRQHSERFLLKFTPLGSPIRAVSNRQAIELCIIHFQGRDEVADA